MTKASRSLTALLTATATLLAVSLGGVTAVASADGPCNQQGNDVLCAYEYSGGVKSLTIFGGAKGSTLSVEAWGGEGGGSDSSNERQQLNWSWSGGLGGYATNTYKVPANTSATVYVAVGRAGWWEVNPWRPTPAGGGGSTIVASAWPPRGLADVIAIAGGGGGSGGNGFGGAGGISGPGQAPPPNYFGGTSGGKGGESGRGGYGANSGGWGLGGPGGQSCFWLVDRCDGAWAADLGGWGGDVSDVTNLGTVGGAGGGGWGGGGSGFLAGNYGSGGGGGSYPASGVKGPPRYGHGAVRMTFPWPYSLSSSAPLGKHCTVRGTSGPDVLVGEDGDVVCGGDGDDKIVTKGSAEVAYGGGGDDTIVLGSDRDVGYGGPGDDRLHGSDGGDTLVGEGGDDRLGGGPGLDVCIDYDSGSTLKACEHDRKGRVGRASS